ncbi:RNA polymerase sigma factor [Frondihabitans sp. PhB188]|uniref:RNA polymerase sigma factor n=1 Tax=Frondihabitans sp. PhB188 TaxID=2485200 RepID=UPI000F498B39|nr:RNA polymerase sigma factor [Frondihabitans sp. PhB188]
MPSVDERSALEQFADPVLARRSGDGDVRAFATLVRRHERVVRVYARRILGSGADVDDVTQDTFLTAWQQLPGLQDTNGVRGWLLTIASRKAIDRVRARRDHDDIDDHEQAARTEDGPEHSVEAASRQRALGVALSTLPVEQRQCWVLKELGGYSYDDIATEIHQPVSTVRGLLSRARKNMIREMEAWR